MVENYLLQFLGFTLMAGWLGFSVYRIAKALEADTNRSDETDVVFEPIASNPSQIDALGELSPSTPRVLAEGVDGLVSTR